MAYDGYRLIHIAREGRIVTATVDAKGLEIAVREPRHLTRSTAVEVTGIYWHFMDGLWVFLFLILFLGR